MYNVYDVCIYIKHKMCAEAPFVTPIARWRYLIRLCVCMCVLQLAICHTCVYIKGYLNAHMWGI